MTCESELETNCELVWCKVNIKGSKTLHVGSFYRHDVSDNTSLGELATSLSRISGNHSIVLGGDFNLPDCDWVTGLTKPKCKYPDQHSKLFNITNDFGLTQHITEPTRIDPFHGTANTLDLIMTNRPNSVISSTVLPGISDHDAAQIEFDAQPIRVTKKPREVPVYKNAKWGEFNNFITDCGYDILNSPPDTDPEELWTNFRDNLQTGTKKFIPHRFQKAKTGLPYITKEIRKLIRKRDRLHA